MTAKSILVVDDEPDVLEAWERALRLAGYSVAASSTARDALKKAEERQFDLVILDFQMPAMKGLELLARIRKSTPLVRAMIISGKLDEGIAEESVTERLRDSVEADLYLHKPVSNERLLEAVSALMTEGGRDHDWKDLAKRALDSKTVGVGKAREEGTRISTELGKKRAKK